MKKRSLLLHMQNVQNVGLNVNYTLLLVICMANELFQLKAENIVLI